MADAPEFVFVKMSEAFVTTGTERPGIVLRRNDDDSADVLVFHHPEDRTGAPIEVWMRVPATEIRVADSGGSVPASRYSGGTGGGNAATGKGRSGVEVSGGQS